MLSYINHASILMSEAIGLETPKRSNATATIICTYTNNKIDRDQRNQVSLVAADFSSSRPPPAQGRACVMCIQDAPNKLFQSGSFWMASVSRNCILQDSYLGRLASAVWISSPVGWWSNSSTSLILMTLDFTRSVHPSTWLDLTRLWILNFISFSVSPPNLSNSHRFHSTFPCP